MPRRYRLEGEDLESLKVLARARYPEGRIVSGDRVRTGGIAGFLAREHYELVVEVSDRRATVPQGPPPGSAPTGLAALLGAAEAAENTMAGASAPTTVSTESPRFADLLDAITAGTGTSGDDAPDPRASGVRPLHGAGDLVMVLGPHDAALRVVRSMADAAGAAGAAVLLAGTLDDGAARPLMEERNRITQARARGVERGQVTLVAYGLGVYGDTTAEHAARVQVLAPDQVWLVVDARMKPLDVARSVQEMRRHVMIDAIAVEAAAMTSTPSTVHDLGLPVGWIDGEAAKHQPA
ncbi:hypothetical protein [Pseudactinotalea terrae]|uniref:hypothetical protein n=1 Tax=Pseudactinotalea terrae TaxID=1743262 RepID=UPI0012E2386A|nr:hypothetical protein [Pseudactinotalea terrae]